MRRVVAAIVLLALIGAVWLYRVELILRVPAEVFGSPHARYALALTLRDAAAAAAWRAAGEAALGTASLHDAPAVLPVAVGAHTPFAARIGNARRGHRLLVTLDTGSGVFLDVFAGNRRIASADAGQRQLTHDVNEEGDLVIRAQAPVGASVEATMTVRAVASLRFPVQGFSPGAVQSVFGDSRDAGRRQHQGIDIFAPRGTPVLAAADGLITPAESNRLGGVVVWQWVPSRGLSLYYAHLDQRAVSSGAFVATGEVVGYVGNTGNARRTAPHLHFGIYARPGGAVDPLPFVCDAPCGERVMHSPPSPRRRTSSAAGVTTVE